MFSHLCEISRIGKSINRESSFQGLGGLRENEIWLLMGMGFLFWDNKGVLKFIVVITVQVCKYTKKHRTVHFKDMLWELYLNKAVIKKKLFMEGF